MPDPEPRNPRKLFTQANPMQSLVNSGLISLGNNFFLIPFSFIDSFFFRSGIGDQTTLRYTVVTYRRYHIVDKSALSATRNCHDWPGPSCRHSPIRHLPPSFFPTHFWSSTCEYLLVDVLCFITWLISFFFVGLIDVQTEAETFGARMLTPLRISV